MQIGQNPTLIDGKLPVFVFPTALNFISDDQSSHKQVLTVYNPYEFALRFKVLCTAPRKYNVVESEGTIKPHCCVDIVVRHKDIAINNEGVKDKIRIQVTEHGQKAVIGKKDIVSVLLPTRDKSQSTEELFESLPPTSAMAAATQEVQQSLVARHGGRVTSGPSLVIVGTAVFCIIALMLPTHGDSQSALPQYLFLSLHQKLIAAYILGLVTMAILRS